MRRGLGGVAGVRAPPYINKSSAVVSVGEPELMQSVFGAEKSELRRLILDVIEVMRVAHSKGLINVLGGNASFRWGNGFWITPSQIPKHRLEVSDFVYVDMDKGPLQNPRGRRPSIEWRMHREIYVALNNVNAVLHTHNPHTLALYSMGITLKPSDYAEAYSIGECISMVPKIPSGTEELARAAAGALSKCRVAVLLGHGIVVAAEDIFKALDAAEALDDISKAELFKHLIRRTAT